VPKTAAVDSDVFHVEEAPRLASLASTGMVDILAFFGCSVAWKAAVCLWSVGKLLEDSQDHDGNSLLGCKSSIRLRGSVVRK
jgi:hypothetical protein